ncbi:hypothetical protein AUEXF2481DRAFT_177478 [Aureobasidium subglaciale EXF-2481]|uniref:Uncharacterized protein n=1 Tax=Aureobasidium subglaciale (strain EXF-2481) TaxID=1043005 RepID=A0A074YZ71_AURSE|nr:uncharacterized protein AUEXF2481DRAFT_177478 [Aureobasidium subglaciale EXF-2481]KEQ99462.1 hypothetical protein AUEXF2481DRAFT_177478 [Aureobasidium subglaciale EXF-2481]
MSWIAPTLFLLSLLLSSRGLLLPGLFRWRRSFLVRVRKIIVPFLFLDWWVDSFSFSAPPPPPPVYCTPAFSCFNKICSFFFFFSGFIVAFLIVFRTLLFTLHWKPCVLAFSDEWILFLFSHHEDQSGKQKRDGKCSCLWLKDDIH